MKKNEINKESLSFDNQIIERINQGYIPDLRRNERNEWFNNNICRRVKWFLQLLVRVGLYETSRH